MAELQGRLPIRVELRALSEADFFRILTEPEFNLIKQQQVNVCGVCGRGRGCGSVSMEWKELARWVSRSA